MLIVHRPRYDDWTLPKGKADHPGEMSEETAVREVLEETGIDAARYELSDWQLRNEYEIYPHWRHRYPDGVTRNTEHVFGLRLPEPFRLTIAADDFTELPFTLEHAEELERLPVHHRDPFDRILVAQARAEGATIVSHDRDLEPYGVSVIWT